MRLDEHNAGPLIRRFCHECEKLGMRVTGVGFIDVDPYGENPTVFQGWSFETSTSLWSNLIHAWVSTKDVFKGINLNGITL